MKQEMVMQVQMHCEKCRSKAMKIAAVTPGVTKVEIQGDDKLVVTGEEVDSVDLAFKLRKKLKHAKILSVAKEKENSEKQKEKKEEATSSISTTLTLPWTSYDPYSQYYCTRFHESNCSIM